jgi:hypothetical protein
MNHAGSMRRPLQGTRLDKYGIPLIFLVLALAALLLIGLGIRNVGRGIASSGWPTAAAEVVASEMTESVSVDKKSRTSSNIYSANIVFRYAVNGKEYTTDLIQFGQTVGSGDSSEAELRRMRYPEGAELTVRYNPNDPSMAVAQPGYHPDSLWLPGAGLAFLLPIVMFYLLYRGSSGGADGMMYGITMFVVIFVLIGLAMLAGGLSRLWHAYQSEKWPSTAGVIIYGKQSASTTATEMSDGEMVRSTSHGTHLVYRFEVGGHKHYSNVRVFGQLAGSDADWADDIAERYPVGKAVQVTYSPANPDLAVLEPGINTEAYYLPGAGAAFLLFGLAVYFFGIPALKGP